MQKVILGCSLIMSMGIAVQASVPSDATEFESRMKARDVDFRSRLTALQDGIQHLPEMDKTEANDRMDALKAEEKNFDSMIARLRAPSVDDHYRSDVGEASARLEAHLKKFELAMNQK